MTCSGKYATVDDFNQFWCLNVDLTDSGVVAEIERMLDLAASDVQSALSASGSCSCAMPGWALTLAKKLNLIDAATIYNCSCGPKFTDEQRGLWVAWLERQYGLIRSQEIDLCGMTGATFPAWASAEQSLTLWNYEQIEYNRILRTGI